MMPSSPWCPLASSVPPIALQHQVQAAGTAQREAPFSIGQGVGLSELRPRL